MYVIIVGGKKVGRSVAEKLIEEKHDVVIVEKNLEICKEMASQLNATVIDGDATSINVLKNAGIENANTLLALTNNEGDNLLICLNAKQMNENCRTIARVDRGEHSKIFKELNIDFVVFPEITAAFCVDEIVGGKEEKNASIERGKIDIMEVTVKANSSVVGKRVKDVEYPKGNMIIALYEGDELRIPNENYEFSENDKLLIIVKREHASKVKEMFK